MQQQEAIALSSARAGHIPVRIIAGTLNSKNRVDTYWSLPENEIVRGNTIEFLGTEWVIEVVNFAVNFSDEHPRTIFVTPLE